jgi:glycosyltransferase involved in cell wall biosynthesis
MALTRSDTRRNRERDLTTMHPTDATSSDPHLRGAARGPLTVGMLPIGGQFEDFFDKIGVSLEQFRDELTGGWLFNYVLALRSAGVRTVLIFTSARVDGPVRFTHAGTGAHVWILPTPRLHLKVRSGLHRFFPNVPLLAGIGSYVATPLRALARVLRQEECSAILCQEYEHPRFDVCVLLGQLLQIPVFATYQGANKTSTPFERPIRRLTIGRCDGLIVASQNEIARVQRTYRIPAALVEQIPNPVGPCECDVATREAVRAELKIGQGTRVAVWHGHVQVRRKGLDVLLDAWDLICARTGDADVLLCLVGSGRNTTVFRSRVETTPKILWIDRYVLDRRKLWGYLAAADVYALSSRHEGFAVAPLEAMACGLPVVATDVSGVRDLLPRGEADGGIVVPSENPSALAEALARLLDDPQLSQRLGKVARRRTEQEFSLDVIGRQLRRFLFPADRQPDIDTTPSWMVASSA